MRAFISTLDTNNVKGKVCDQVRQHAQLGNLTLVAGHCGGYVALVDLTANGYGWRTLMVLQDASDDVSTGAQDLLGSGTSELVVHRTLTYSGGFIHCSAVWPTIYAWSGSNYTNVS